MPELNTVVDTNAALQNCRSWLAEYAAVPGIGNCDRDTFNGSVDRLKALGSYNQTV